MDNNKETLIKTIAFNLINPFNDSGSKLYTPRLLVDNNQTIYMLIYIDSNGKHHSTICDPYSLSNETNILTQIAEEQEIRQCTYYKAIEPFQLCRSIAKYCNCLDLQSTISVDDVNDIINMIIYNAPPMSNIVHKIYYVHKLSGWRYLLLNTKYGIFDMISEGIIGRDVFENISVPLDFSYIISDSLINMQKWAKERKANNPKLMDFLSSDDYMKSSMVDFHNDCSNHVYSDDEIFTMQDNPTPSLVGCYNDINLITEQI